MLEKWLTWAERHKTGVSGIEHRLLTVRSDKAKEFKAVEKRWQLTEIDFEYTEPYTPAQNGVAERLNRLLLEITRALLFDTDVPNGYWAWAAETAKYIRNRPIEVKDTGKTPFELWFGSQPNLHQLRRWGCKVLYHEKESDKMVERAKTGTFIGYTTSESQYFVMTGERRIRKVTNLVFLESHNGPLSKNANSGGSHISDHLLEGDLAMMPDVEGQPIVTSSLPLVEKRPNNEYEGRRRSASLQSSAPPSAVEPETESRAVNAVSKNPKEKLEERRRSERLREKEKLKRKGTSY